MGWIAAGRVVAGVKDTEVIGHFDTGKHESDPVCFVEAVIQFEETIPRPLP